jgi:acyl carrier protein
MTSPADDEVRELTDYIAREIIHSTDVALDADTPLFSSGLLDSLAVTDILHKLEDVTGLRIATGRLRLRDVDSVRLMLAAARRAGKPRTQP